MTEDEAKTKSCYRGKDGPGSVIYRATPEIIFCCIGSECMAWRWNQSPKSNAERQQQASNPLGQLRGPHGYCGLAGKPQ